MHSFRRLPTVIPRFCSCWPDSPAPSRPAPAPRAPPPPGTTSATPGSPKAASAMVVSGIAHRERRRPRRSCGRAATRWTRRWPSGSRWRWCIRRPATSAAAASWSSGSATGPCDPSTTARWPRPGASRDMYLDANGEPTEKSVTGHLVRRSSRRRGGHGRGPPQARAAALHRGHRARHPARPGRLRRRLIPLQFDPGRQRQAVSLPSVPRELPAGGSAAGAGLDASAARPRRDARGDPGQRRSGLLSWPRGRSDRGGNGARRGPHHAARISPRTGRSGATRSPSPIGATPSTRWRPPRPAGPRWARS